MKLLRKHDYPDGRFTLAFVGFDEEVKSTVIELTYNWDTNAYLLGTGYGHIAISVKDIYATCATLQELNVSVTRLPGPMQHDPNEMIAFIEDPDGYRIELIEIKN